MALGLFLKLLSDILFRDPKHFVNVHATPRFWSSKQFRRTCALRLSAFGGKFNLTKNKSVRSRFSKFHILIGRETDHGPQAIFAVLRSLEIRPSLKRQQQHQFNSMRRA